jgi:4'-phosphopantetheinyl transferase EntD
MTPDRPAAALEAAFKTLFPDEVAMAVERIVPEQPDSLWPEERAAMTGAVPARLAEFAAGRRAARRALAALGEPPVALPMGQDRAPTWPAGISGSIAHAAGFAIAVARHGGPLGVDLEEDAPIEPDLWPLLCAPDELRQLEDGDTGRLVRWVFAAKEAVFKAQEAGQRAMFGHDAVAVTLVADGFRARFNRDAGTFKAGQNLRGRLALFEGLVLAGVAW